ncbi:MAG: DUF1109 family protein [Bdellovibrionales bacterium]|nr:DUF1109 family protein [Bdellovibrionales bacterium]
MPTKEHFIQSLQQELTPVTPLRSPRVRAALWSLVTLVFSVGVLLLTGPIRPGAFQQMLGVQFALETIIGFLPLWTASYVLFRLNIPGIEVSRGDVILAFAPMLMFLVFLIYGLYVAPALEPSMLGKRHHCVFEVLYVSLLPLVFLIWQLSKGYSLYSPTQFMLMGVAASSVPMATMQLVCMYEPSHILKFHFGPAVMVALLTAILGLLWMKLFKS